MSRDDRLDAARALLGATAAVVGLVVVVLGVDGWLRAELPAEAARAAVVAPLSLGPAGRGELVPGGEHPAVPLEPAPRMPEIPGVLP